MKLCAAQFQPSKGNIDPNVEKHLALIDLAVTCGAGLIVFPELSLTGYEPELVGDLATSGDNARLEIFQELSEQYAIIIAVGLPTRGERGTLISTVIFHPRRARQTYSKQMLHSDELPFFVAGDREIVFSVDGHSFTPAICYESLQNAHAEKAAGMGADVYLACVAKPEQGVAQAYAHYPEIAKRHSMLVLMSNCIGPCDNFVAAGGSAAWNRRGELLVGMSPTQTGLVLVDMETETAEIVEL